MTAGRYCACSNVRGSCKDLGEWLIRVNIAQGQRRIWMMMMVEGRREQVMTWLLCVQYGQW